MDEDILFRHALDESWLCFGRLEAILRGGAFVWSGPGAERDAVTLKAEFELHGATLRMLAGWQPENPLFRQGVADWEGYESSLCALGLH